MSEDNVPTLGRIHEGLTQWCGSRFVSYIFRFEFVCMSSTPREQVCHCEFLPSFTLLIEASIRSNFASDVPMSRFIFGTLHFIYDLASLSVLALDWQFGIAGAVIGVAFHLACWLLLLSAHLCLLGAYVYMFHYLAFCINLALADDMESVWIWRPYGW